MDRSKMREAGINYSEGINRFAGNKELYEKYLKLFFECNELEQLREDVKGGYLSRAFSEAHSLKGETGNLSLIRLYEKISELTEMLRKTDELTHMDSSTVEKIMLDIDATYENARHAVCD